MISLQKRENLNLYFYLSQNSELTFILNDILVKLEKEVFGIYTVKEIEEFRLIYKCKGII